MTELTEIQKRFLQHKSDEEKKELVENADLISSFKAVCAKKGITLTDENFTYIQAIGIVAEYPNLVAHLNSQMVRDKEGLNDFKFLNTIFMQRNAVSGYLYSDKYMIMAHPNFRRGLHPNSNFAPRFIDLFWRMRDPEIESLIALDFNRVRVDIEGGMYFEEDTWYGARFNNEIDSIPDGIIKLRPPSDVDDFLISFYFSDTYSLDIKWETKEGVKSFQAEEFKTETRTIRKDGIDFYPAKYVHAEFDLEKNHFRHFDGAIHFYTGDEYFRRRDSDFNYNSKNTYQIKTSSEKLFKLNGNIEVSRWIEFTSHFLTGNPLVIEYFEGKVPDDIVEVLEIMKKSKTN